MIGRRRDYPLPGLVIGSGVSDLGFELETLIEVENPPSFSSNFFAIPDPTK